MSYDVEIVIRVDFTAPDGKSRASQMQGYSHIRLLDDDTHQRWHVVGQHDHRFPGTGDRYLTFNRDGNTIFLLNKHNHTWAELQGFGRTPHQNDKGDVYVSNRNYSSCPYTKDHRWGGHWSVNRKAHHNNLPLIDPNDGWYQQMIDACSDDTGWRYDTSSGAGGTGGAVLGGGLLHQTLVFKRKEEVDKRRWNLTINAAGVGLMTPGIGVSGSTESSPSMAITEVRRGPGGKLPMPVEELAGNILFFDGGGGFGVGGGKRGLGVGASVTTYVFIGGPSGGAIPNIASVKAVLQIASGSGGGGKSGLGLSAGLQGLVYAGRVSVAQRHT